MIIIDKKRRRISSTKSEKDLLNFAENIGIPKTVYFSDEKCFKFLKNSQMDIALMFGAEPMSSEDFEKNCWNKWYNRITNFLPFVR